MCGYRTWAEDRANAEFFAAARTLLPQLVAEIDADEVAPSLKWAIATPQRATHTRTSERSAERGQFNDDPPF